MALISFDEEEVIAFIPESQRDCDDPLTIHMKYVPYKMVQKYRRIIADRTKAGSKGSSNFAKVAAISAEVSADVQRKQFTDNVVKIENYIIKGEQVTDPGIFYDRVSDELLTEIIKAMESESKLSDGQKKITSQPLDINTKKTASIV